MKDNSKDVLFLDFHPLQNSAVKTTRCVQHTLGVSGSAGLLYERGAMLQVRPKSQMDIAKKMILNKRVSFFGALGPNGHMLEY